MEGKFKTSIDKKDEKSPLFDALTDLSKDNQFIDLKKLKHELNIEEIKRTHDFKNLKLEDRLFKNSPKNDNLVNISHIKPNKEAIFEPIDQNILNDKIRIKQNSHSIKKKNSFNDGVNNISSMKKDENPNIYFKSYQTEKNDMSFSESSKIETAKSFITSDNLNIPRYNSSDNRILSSEINFVKSLFNEIKFILFKIRIDSETYKDDMIRRNRLIENYLNDKDVNLRLFEIDEQEMIDIKCNEILDFKKRGLNLRLRRFYDEYPLFNLRSFIYRYSTIFSYYCELIIQSRIFEILTNLLILANSIIIFISDPTDQTSINEITDTYFLSFYTFEMIIKVLALGLIINEDSYLRGMWNHLDLFIIVIGWIVLSLSSSNTNNQNGRNFGQLTSLRTFRLLRPLKAVKNIKALRNILQTIFISFINLGNLSIVLVSFFTIYSIWSVQMWIGNINQRCMSVNLGNIYDISNYTTQCTTNLDCSDFGNNTGNQFICVESYFVPNTGITSYNTIFNALITNFIISTTEGWTDFYNQVGNTFKGNNGFNKIIQDLYFLTLIFGGGFYLFNLYLAVIYQTYQQIEQLNKKRIMKSNKKLVDAIREKKEEEGNDNFMKIDKYEKILAEEMEKFDIFKKNENHISKNYETIKDVYLLENYKAEEIFNLKKNIRKMKSRALRDYNEYKIELKKKAGIDLEDIDFKKGMPAQKILETYFFPSRMISAKEEVKKSISLNEQIKKFEIFQDILEKSKKKTVEFFQQKNKFCLKLMKNKIGKKYKDIEYNLKIFLNEIEDLVENQKLNDKKDEVKEKLLKTNAKDFKNDLNLSIVHEETHNFSNNKLKLKNENSKQNFNQIEIENSLKYRKSSSGSEFARKFISLDENEMSKNKLEIITKRGKMPTIISPKQNINLRDTANVKEEKSNKKELNYRLENNKFKSGNYYMRTQSITKNKYKFPFLEKMIEDNSKYKSDVKLKNEILKDEKERIEQYNLSSYRKNLKYKYNIIDKEISYKEKFKIDSNKEYVFLNISNNRKNEKINDNNIMLDKEERKEDIFVYNNQNEEDLIYSYYFPYEKKEFKEEEIIFINHHLENLSLNCIYDVTPKEKDFGLNKFYLNKPDVLKRTTSFLEKNSFSESLNMNSTIRGGSIMSSIKTKKTFKRNSTISLSMEKIISSMMSVSDLANQNVFTTVDKMDFKTLSHYFLNSEEIIEKCLKIKNKKQKPKPDFFGTNKQISKIFNFDLDTKSRKFITWSGQDVLNFELKEENYATYNNIMKKMENINIIIWPINIIKKIWNQICWILYIIIQSTIFELILMSLVIGNSIVLSLYGNILSNDEQKKLNSINDIFTFCFLFELIIKIMALGVIEYFSDISNHLDIIVVICGLIDIEISTYFKDTKSNAIKSIKIFRVLRILRLFKNIKTMKRILHGIVGSLSKIIYVLIILVLFILIYMILGMSLILNDNLLRGHLNAFYLVFQILSIENWNSILYQIFYDNGLAIIYLISWIVIGNWILFNLFMAIILDSFEIIEENEEIKFTSGFPELFKMHLNNSKIDKKNINNLTVKKSQKENVESDSEEEEEAKERVNDEISQLQNKFEKKDLKKNEKLLIENEISFRLFQKVECEKSLFIFSQKNPFRVKLMKIFTNKNFERTILFMIFLVSLRLIIDTFYDDSNISVMIFASLDLTFSIIFFCEFLIKIISLGFVLDEGSYLMDNWNKMDFLVLIIQIIELQSLSFYKNNGNKQFLKILRLLRILRPLRFISQNEEMKIIISSILDSFILIFNVIIIFFLAIFIFSLTGILLLYDAFKFCVTPGRSFTQDYPYVLVDSNITNIIDCQNLNPQNNFNVPPMFTFQNISDAFVTTYALFNTEGWPDLMNSFRVFNPNYGLFYISIILIGNFFFLNLFQGVLFGTFCDSYRKEKEQDINETKESQLWWDFLNQIEEIKPDYILYTLPNNKFQKEIYLIITSKKFDLFIFFIIFTNLIILGMSYSDANHSYNEILNLLNIFFSSIFFIEFILKIIALGFKGYFFSIWNIMDLFIVITSAINISLTYGSDTKNIYFKAFQSLRIFRILKLTKVMKSIKSLKSLEQLIHIIKWSIKSLLNMFLLMILIYSIFAIFGCYLFDFNKNHILFQSKYNDQYFNFNNYYYAIWAVFRFTTGENWPQIMKEYYHYIININLNSTADNSMGYAEYLVVPFFFSLIFFCQYIFLNLFLMIAIQQYSDFVEKSENPVEKFNENAEYFKKAWNRFASQKSMGYKMKINHLLKFFENLKGDLGFGNFREKNQNQNHINKHILELKLLKDKNNYFYFKDVLFKSFKYKFGRFNNKPNKIKIEENKIMSNILVKMSHTSNDNMDFFNPLTSRLYYVISFSFIQAFIKNYQFNLEKKKMNPDDIEDIMMLNDNRLLTENMKLVTHDNFNKE